MRADCQAGSSDRTRGEATWARRPIFELCCETLDACQAARDGGADRIEICSRLDVDGLTPPRWLIEQAIGEYQIPVHVLIRPSPLAYHCDEFDFSLMCTEIQHARAAGASGIVTGMLQSDGTVDKERIRALVELAYPMEVTFHRAFDQTADLDRALEDVIDAGCHRVLTSGGAADALAGSATLARLVARAAGRVAVAVGGGLRVGNAAQLAQRTGARHFHGSLTIEDPAPSSLTERVRMVVQILRDETGGVSAPAATSSAAQAHAPELGLRSRDRADTPSAAHPPAESEPSQ